MHGPFWRPSPLQTTVHRISRNPLLASPRGHAHGFPVNGQKDVRGPVLGLLPPRGPPHISGLIITIVVDSIDRIGRRWPQSNVLNKSLESAITKPFLTHTNPVFIGTVHRTAARMHCLPDHVFGAKTARAVTVSRLPSAHALQTPPRLAPPKITRAK